MVFYGLLYETCMELFIWIFFMIIVGGLAYLFFV